MNIFQKSNNPRTQNAKINILKMLLLKGGNILIGLLLVPMTINYVDSETYGIWLTISSMVAWMAFFDIGINNGLKNKLTEALAKGDTKKAKSYVSTTYAILTLIFIPLMMAALLVVQYLDWPSILNVDYIGAKALTCAMCIVVVYFCLNFILSTINVIMLADQRPADQSLRTFIQQLVSLVIIYAMTILVPGSLINLCLALCIVPIIVILAFNISLFNGRYKAIAPTIKSVDFRLTPDLLRLGFMFFIIQIAGVIQYQMTNFLIIHHYGATDVTAYNIAYKYFSIAFMIWGILTTPIWAAVADAIAKGDYTWISNTVRKYEKMFAIFVMGMFVMLAVSPTVFHIWIGDSVTISITLSFWVMLFTLVMMFSTIYVSVLNGASILKIQSIMCLFSPIIFLTVCFVLMHLGLGVESILIASIVANINGLIVAPIQYRQFIHSKRNIQHESHN